MATSAAATKKDDDLSWGAIAAIVGVLASGCAVFVGGLLIAHTIVDAYVVMKLWQWFIPGIFPTLPVLAYWQAAGLVLVVRAIRPNDPEWERESDGEYKHPGTNFLVRLAISPAIVLLLGLFVRHFI